MASRQGKSRSASASYSSTRSSPGGRRSVRSGSRPMGPSGEGSGITYSGGGSSSGGSSGSSGRRNRGPTIDKNSDSYKMQKFGSKTGYVVVQTSQGYKRVHVSEISPEGVYSGGSGGSVIQGVSESKIQTKQAPKIITRETQTTKQREAGVFRENPFKKVWEQGKSEAPKPGDITEAELRRRVKVQEEKEKQKGIFPLKQYDTAKEKAIEGAVEGALDVREKRIKAGTMGNTPIERFLNKYFVGSEYNIPDEKGQYMEREEVKRRATKTIMGTAQLTEAGVVGALPVGGMLESVGVGGKALTAGNWAGWLGKSSVMGAQIPEGFDTLTQAKENKEVARLRKSLTKKQLAEASQYRQQAEFEGEAWYKKTFGEISFIKPFLGSEEKALAGAEEYGEKVLGLSGKELKSFVELQKRERLGREIIGGTVGDISAEFAGEFSGGGMLRRTFKTVGKVPKKQAFKTLFGTGFKSLFPAGTVEATAGYFSQTSAQREEFDPLEYGTTAIIGGTTAGLFGGLITGFSGVQKEGARAVTQGAVYVMDPLEPIGDVGGDVFGKLGSSMARVPVITPTVAFSPTKGETITLGTSTSTKTKTFTPTTTKTKVKSKTPTAVNLPEVSFVGVEEILKSPSKIQTSTNTDTPTDTTTPTEDNTIVGDVPINPNIIINTQKSNAVNIPTFTPVNVATPRPFLPPPILPAVPPINLGGGAGRFSKRNKKRYRSELKYGFSLLGLTDAFPTIKGKKSKKTKKKEQSLFPEIRLPAFRGFK